MKQRFRKLVVSLKRQPHSISLLMLVVCCMVYTFKLSAHSNASMYVSSRIIALYVFIITLCSMLVIFSSLNAFARRQKHRGLMQAVVYLLIGIQLLFDGLYLNVMVTETVRRDPPVPITPDIAASMNGTTLHMILLGVTLLMILTLPLYSRALQKIDTTIQDPELTEILHDQEEEPLLEDDEEWL